MENRHGLVVGGGASLATGTVEREEALALVDRRRGRRRITLGADKAFDVDDFWPRCTRSGRCSTGIVRSTESHRAR